jgi:hypothetical protein
VPGRVKGAWENLFERRYGFWRGLLNGVVARYFDRLMLLEKRTETARPIGSLALLRVRIKLPILFLPLSLSFGARWPGSEHVPFKGA